MVSYICDQGYGSNNTDIVISCTADLEWTTAGGICKGVVKHFDYRMINRTDCTGWPWAWDWWLFRRSLCEGDEIFKKLVDNPLISALSHQPVRTAPPQFQSRTVLISWSPFNTLLTTQHMKNDFLLMKSVGCSNTFMNCEFLQHFCIVNIAYYYFFLIQPSTACPWDPTTTPLYPVTTQLQEKRWLSHAKQVTRDPPTTQMQHLQTLKFWSVCQPKRGTLQLRTARVCFILGSSTW